MASRARDRLGERGGGLEGERDGEGDGRGRLAGAREGKREEDAADKIHFSRFFSLKRRRQHFTRLGRYRLRSRQKFVKNSPPGSETSSLRPCQRRASLCLYICVCVWCIHTPYTPFRCHERKSERIPVPKETDIRIHAGGGEERRIGRKQGRTRRGKKGTKFVSGLINADHHPIVPSTGER